jgi:hypothetical protein
MKKILIITTATTTIILLAIFSNFANEASKPYLSKLIESKIDGNISVEVEEYKLDYNYITLFAKINEKSNIKIYGKIDALSQNFDLNYTLQSTEQPINVKGTAKGRVEDMIIDGHGDALSSKLVYEFQLENSNPKNIKIDIKKGNIEEFSKITNTPKYANGLFDIDIDMPKFEKNSFTGDIKLKLYKTELNSKVIQEEKNITIPPKTTIYGDILSNIKGEEASIDGDIKSNIANLILKNGKINLKKAEPFFFEYVADVKDLKHLKTFINKELKGALKVAGVIEKKDKEFHISGTTNSFDGEIDFNLLNDDLEADMKKVSIEKLFYTIDYPTIFSSTLSGKLIYNLKNQIGKLDSELIEAKLIESKLTEKIKKFTSIDLTKEVYNNTIFSANVHGNRVEFKLLAKNKHNKISIYDAKLDRYSNYINAKYKIDIKGKDVGGRIKGDIDSPKISVSSSKFIEKETRSMIEEYIDRDSIDDIKNRLKDLGLDEEKTDKAINKAKKFLKGFF